MPKVISINKLNIDLISIECNKVKYNGEKFYLNTGFIECPYGINDNKFIADLKEPLLSKFNNLDTWIKENINRDDYIPLISDKKITIFNTETTKVFDKNGDIIEDSDVLFSARFVASFLLDMSEITNYKEKCLLSHWPLQIKIKEFSLLPEGCVICSTKKEFYNNKSLNLNLKKEDIDVIPQAVQYDPNVNDLLS